MPRIRKLHLVTTLELFFDATLLLIFMAQAFVVGCLLIYGHLPIPTNWGNQLIAKKLPSGIVLSIDEIRLRSDASIEFEGIEVRAANIEQSLFRADAAELELKWQGFNISLEQRVSYYTRGHFSPHLCIRLMETIVLY